MARIPDGGQDWETGTTTGVGWLKKRFVGEVSHSGGAGRVLTRVDRAVIAEILAESLPAIRLGSGSQGEGWEM